MTLDLVGLWPVIIGLSHTVCDRLQPYNVRDSFGETVTAINHGHENGTLHLPREHGEMLLNGHYLTVAVPFVGTQDAQIHFMFSTGWDSEVEANTTLFIQILTRAHHSHICLLC